MNGIYQIMGNSTPATNRPAWAERLIYRRLIVLKKKSQTAVALDVGVEQSSISLLEAGKTDITELPPSRLTAIAKAYGYRDIFEMQDDIGLDFKLGQPPPLLNEVTARDYPDHVLLDIEPLSAAAGMPAYAAESQHSEKYIMPKSHYRPSIRIFTAKGDSMAREGGFGIQDGDSLVVDTHELNPRDDKVFVVQDEAGAVVVKRLRNWSGDWWLTSDNPKYPPFKLHEARVLGRVVKAEGERDF